MILADYSCSHIMLAGHTAVEHDCGRSRPMQAFPCHANVDSSMWPTWSSFGLQQPCNKSWTKMQQASLC